MTPGITIARTPAGPRAATGFARKATRRGFSLLEIAAVTGIVALMLAGVMRLYSTAEMTRNISDSMVEIVLIESIYDGLCASNDCANFNDVTIAGTGQLPSKWVNAAGGAKAGITNPFGLPVNAYADIGMGGQELVIIHSVPVRACSEIMTKDPGVDTIYVTNAVGKFVGITVGGSAAIPVPVALEVCNLAASNGFVGLYIVHSLKV